jgi:two-component system OmpR family sensor kinase
LLTVLRRAAALARKTGIRARLTAAIALITLAALGATFVAVYQGTGSDLRQQIDRDLGEDAGALIQQVAGARPLAPAAVVRRAQRYINSQPQFGPSFELIVVQAPGVRAATNDPELLGPVRKTEPGETVGEGRAELAEGRAIRSAPDGYSTVKLRDAGEVRLLTRQLIGSGREVGRVTIGQPLTSVHSAQAGVSRTFLLAGSLALVAALAAVVAVASRTTKPLRRMAQAAEAVDSGELSTRMNPHGSAEARQLAESFNHMLDRLEDAFSRQRAFVSDASHELRTPLTAIRGQIEVLARAPDASDETTATAEVVARQVERMERLVEDMLVLAQADERIAHDPKPVEVKSFLPEILATSFLGVDRKLELGPVPNGTLVADSDRLTQVIGNLVGNAIEHTSSGGSIRVAAAAADGRLRITIDDDGPGIPLTQRDRVFGRFYRADPSRSRNSGGSGLGLAIAKAIVEAHGGRIWVDAAPRGGARVAFELPGFHPSTP